MDTEKFWTPTGGTDGPEPDWEQVLCNDPARADAFDGWSRLGGFAIARILSRQPQLARYCDLGKLKPLAWIRLLRRQPQFAAHCDKWEEMRKYNPRMVERLHGEKSLKLSRGGG